MAKGSYSIPGFEFGRFFLDTTGRRLLRDHIRVPISPTSLKLLEVLLRNRKRVVTNKELRILVWADDPTQTHEPSQDKNALYIAVRKLKAALDEYGKWIVNVRGVGYTFSEEVEVKETAGANSNLPQSTTSFVGRESEIPEIQELLDKTRLLTLTGAPGIGKTRLAIRAGAITESFSDGIYLVDLVTISDEKLVPKAVTAALGVNEEHGRSVMDTLRDYLKTKELLLILDNCEHVIEGTALLAESLLRTVSGLKILATSRQPLDVSGETVLQIQPLSFPLEEQTLNVDEIINYEAVELFIELAKQRNPHFKVNKQNVFTIAELCRKLEGIPLAIELAAAQIDSLRVEQILLLMTDRFKLLRRSGGESSRHQTLEAAIDWSYESLSEEEKALLRRLSIFIGGWTIEAAAEVCSGADINKGDVLYLLSRLIKKSLIRGDERDRRIRYRMLEMIRQYSIEKLQKRDETAKLSDKHARYFVQLSERAFEEGERGDWMNRLEDEHPNLRQALRHTIREGGDIEMGLRLCGALGRFWFIRGHISEATHWTEKALELDDGRSKDARARALRTGGFFFGHMADSDEDSKRGRECFDESVAIWRNLENRKELARTLTNYSFLLNRQGDFPSAIRAVRESLNIFNELGDLANIARAAHNLALSLLDQGDYDQAIPLFEESLENARKPEVADQHLQALCLHNLGEAEFYKGDLDAAYSRLEQSLTISDELGHRSLSARTAIIQGEVAVRQGDYKLSLKKQRGALGEFKAINDKQGIIDALEAIACTYSSIGDNRLAMILYGGAQSLRATSKISLGPYRQRLLDQCLNASRESLGADEAQRLLSEGQEHELETIIKYAMEAA